MHLVHNGADIAVESCFEAGYCKKGTWYLNVAKDMCLTPFYFREI